MNSPSPESPPQLETQTETERHQLLKQLENFLETPMLILGFVWLGLLVWEFIAPNGLSAPLQLAGEVIWAIFVFDFTLKFVLAPKKLHYLRANWLTALALMLPALRIFRIVRVVRLLRVARAARGVRFFRLISGLNRGMKALSGAMGRRGIGYIVALTGIILLAGAAGMFAFENGDQGFQNFGQSLWWTAMLMTTLGSEHWPHSSEGRALCFLLSLFAFTIFGYVTATLATFFVGRDAQSAEAELAGADDVRALCEEIAALREEIRALSQSGNRSGE